MAIGNILADVGVREMRLITNNPKKIVGLEGYGLRIVDRVALPVNRTPFNERYIETKRSKLGHMLEGARSGAERAS